MIQPLGTNQFVYFPIDLLCPEGKTGIGTGLAYRQTSSYPSNWGERRIAIEFKEKISSLDSIYFTLEYGIWKFHSFSELTCLEVGERGMRPSVLSSI